MTIRNNLICHYNFRTNVQFSLFGLIRNDFRIQSSNGQFEPAGVGLELGILLPESLFLRAGLGIGTADVPHCLEVNNLLNTVEPLAILVGDHINVAVVLKAVLQLRDQLRDLHGSAVVDELI